MRLSYCVPLSWSLNFSVPHFSQPYNGHKLYTAQVPGRSNEIVSGKLSQEMLSKYSFMQELQPCPVWVFGASPAPSPLFSRGPQLTGQLL